MRKFSRKFTVVVAGAVLLLAGTGVAYAFWTAGGTGTGSAGTGVSADVVVQQTSTVTAMGPGVAPQTLSGNFDNANTGPVYVTDVTVSIDGVTQALGAVGACTAADYALVNPTMPVNAEVPAGTGVGAWSGATIAFANSGVNQDGCQGATVNLLYTVS
ncbi:hypothetical protein [Umezawaea sp. Da 62-37]|uniref:hypothetical protein n=1 Tax=Umezawaea sp. Da 62-37 TaxID=3075927 RepID=UPI0028F6DC2A|nr:hypothetical protein [Umezawaea sp. Da 62-37]WNV86086.1 hypothetical protein RM788_49575 [Umezawaea sp. Da 62-37]